MEFGNMKQHNMFYLSKLWLYDRSDQHNGVNNSAAVVCDTVKIQLCSVTTTVLKAL